MHIFIGDSNQSTEDQDADKMADGKAQSQEVSVGNTLLADIVERSCVLCSGRKFVYILLCPETLWETKCGRLTNLD